MLEAFRRGEEDALSQVYHHYVDNVMDMIRSGVYERNSDANIFGITDPEIQFDVVQETFTRAFALKARLAFDGIRPYRNYLTTIARNVLIDYWRRRSTDPLAKQRELSGDGTGSAPDSVDACNSMFDSAVHIDRKNNDVEQDLYDQLLIAAAHEYRTEIISADYKVFVNLRYIEGLSQSEVASKLGITRWKVRRMENKTEDGLYKYLLEKKIIKKTRPKKR